LVADIRRLSCRKGFLARFGGDGKKAVVAGAQLDPYPADNGQDRNPALEDDHVDSAPDLVVDAESGSQILDLYRAGIHSEYAPGIVPDVELR
jgi:hypothetical protein